MAETAAALFRAQASRFGDRLAFRELHAGGAPADRAWSWREWERDALRFAGALLATGHQPGERVAVLAGNHAVWPIADLGILLAGGVSVGLYPTSAPAQVRHVLADAEARVVVADTVEQQAKVHGALPGVAAAPRVVGPEGWQGWLECGDAALAAGAERDIAARIAAQRPDDTALLIYTSGSTGEPRGACIPHRYLLASAESIRTTLGLAERDSMLSFLPFCHAAERVFGLHTRIACGMETGLVPDHTRLWEAARAYGPTVFGGLPRFFEKAYEHLQAEQQQRSGPERLRWERTLELGRERSRLRRAGREVPGALEWEWVTVGTPLFGQVRALFGGRIRVATCGGAALPEQVAEYLDALGLTVLGAYGLTEHLCVAFNRPESYAFDAAGPPMPGTELRLAPDGEILIRRGALTFGGYLRRPDDTAAAFTGDGDWLRTGDLGEMDTRGMLRVRGRKKELIALSTGKKVAPLPIEAQLAQDPWIGQAVLHGEGRRFITALLALRRPVLEAWAVENGLFAPFDSLIRDERVLDRLQRTVDRVNADLSRTEQIRRWAVLPDELSAERDELTPTLKVRRSVVEQSYRSYLDPLYA